MTTRKSRRDFLRSCCALGAAGVSAHLTRLGLIQANAQGSDFRALVCVFLFGGMDSNNVVVPLDSARYTQYQRGRGPIALAANTLLPISGKGGREAYGLHPQMAGIQQLYNRGRVAISLNVGTLVRPVTRAEIRNGNAPVPRNLYSHSDQTQQWQTSNPMGGGSGWGGRAVDNLPYGSSLGFPIGVSVNGNSLFLNGAASRPLNVNPGSRFGIDSFGDPNADLARYNALQQILTLDSGVSMIATASSIAKAGINNAKAINDALNSGTPLQTVFPQNGIGGQLAQVARVIAARNSLGMQRQIFFCGMGGYDNHNDLIPSMTNLLGQLAPAMTSFHAATEELGVANQVTLFTESEFNRTFNSNTGIGSDHAWGGHHLAIGGAVRGEVYGRLPELVINGPEDAGDRGLWIPSASLDQYGATLATWFGVPAPQLGVVFPNLGQFGTNPLAFL